jgi:hypothetical protein
MALSRRTWPSIAGSYHTPGKLACSFSWREQTTNRHYKMARGLRGILHVARKMLGEVQGWAEDSWAHGSHPELGAWKARCRNSCVASYPSMRQEAVVVEAKSVGDVV